MATSVYTYIAGDGSLRNRLVEGAGTIGDPDRQIIINPEENVLLTTISGRLPTIGQKVRSGSVPVVIASDQNIVVTSPSYTGFVSLGVSAGGNIKNSAGQLFGIVATNANAATRFIQIFNKATGPILNDVPVLSYPVYPNYGTLMIDANLWGYNGLGFATGISWGYSSSWLTFTPATPAECVFEARFL